MTNLVGDTVSYLQLFVLLVVARCVYLLVYRLYLHPLKAFPGPRLAAVTDYYQGYFEVWKNGMFVQHLDKLHEVYGLDVFCIHYDSDSDILLEARWSEYDRTRYVCCYESCVRC